MLKNIWKYVKQSVAMKTVSDVKHLVNVSSLYILPDPVSSHSNFYIISFEQVYYEIFLS